MNDVLKAARDIKAMCFIDEDQGRGDEVRRWATLDENLVAERIEELLADQHRKTWALAIECAAKCCEAEAYKCSTSETGVFKRMVCNGRAFDIRNLPCPPIKATKDK